MRICLYTETALPMLGGQELVVDALARQFLSHGHEAFVLAPPPRHPLKSNDGALPYMVVRHPRFISTRRFLDWYCQYLVKEYRRHRFDILHCHSVYPTGYIAARCAAVAGVPLVITSHCGDVCPSSRLLHKPGLPERFALALRHAEAVVAISRFTQERILQLCPHVRRVERIPNGVDVRSLEQSAPPPIGVDHCITPHGYFLFVGRLVFRKGVDLLIDAFSATAKDHQMCLAIAGDGPDRESLERRAVAAGLGERVRFLGVVAGATKSYLLQNALALVIPSRISEGFPLVVLESYAAGRPVIGTEIPGLNEAVRPGQTGLLVPPESTTGLAFAIRQLAADPGAAHALGTEARHDIGQFAWSVVAERHLVIYEELLNQTRTRAA